MRRSIARNLQTLLRPGARGGQEEAALLGIGPDGDVTLPEEFDWRDYTIFLLHVAAEIEHSLMVQYLYAAYSLADDANASKWREIILGIAKEEMGHLITVQNILRALGAPIHLEREDYPYRSEFYPFHFRLEPLTRKSLARYIYAEAPEDAKWQGAEADQIRALAKGDEPANVNRVGVLYNALVKLFEDPNRIRNEEFLATTVRYQATWDEYGRGYRAGQRGDQSGANVRNTPDVLIDTVSDRATAVAALKRIAEQGESPPDAETPKSHFARFLQIFQELAGAEPPTRPIPKNPTTNDIDVEGGTPIKNLLSMRWCSLFNLRYRMLLFRLKHAFFVRAGAPTDRPTARGNLVAWTFAEMYNLRTIAGIVVDLPLEEDADATARAGPPFEMPYTLSLPDWDSDKWRAHRALIADSRKLIKLLLENNDPQADYLAALDDADKLADQLVQSLMARALEQEARP